MEQLFREESQFIRIYYSVEQETDPFEHTVELTDLPSLPIKAIVTDLIASQAIWKMPGIKLSKAKEIIIEKKYRSLIEISEKIKVDDDYYEGWKENGKLQIRQEGDYLRIYIYSKHT